MRLRNSVQAWLPRGMRHHLRHREHVKIAYDSVARFPRIPDAPRHDLPAQLVVSLTSYPARYATLDLTLKGLLDQTVRPDALVLWLAAGDVDTLPKSVVDLQRHGLSIRSCNGLRSFNKLLPALSAWPQAFIVTADDDIYYPPSWLDGLVRGHDTLEPAILCYRAHRFATVPGGTLAPYKHWERNVTDPDALKPSRDLFATGVGGVLYPPGALGPEVDDREMIAALSPFCDDTWFFAHWYKAGWRCRVVAQIAGAVCWPGSQHVALWRRGDDLKDRHLADTTRHFGIVFHG